MNQTKIKCQYETGFLEYIDLELDLTIQPMIGDITLYWDGETFHHLKAYRRQIVKNSDGTTLYVTFKNTTYND